MHLRDFWQKLLIETAIFHVYLLNIENLIYLRLMFFDCIFIDTVFFVIILAGELNIVLIVFLHYVLISYYNKHLSKLWILKNNQQKWQNKINVQKSFHSNQCGCSFDIYVHQLVYLISLLLLGSFRKYFLLILFECPYS